jgi:hypothetical protein
MGAGMERRISMSVTTNTSLNVDSYYIWFNFVQSKSGSSDRVSVIILYDAKKLRLAQLHFYPGRSGFTVSEQKDYVDIMMSSDNFKDIYQVLRSEKPLYITFFRDNVTKVLNNVWFGTETYEMVGEEEGKGS